MVTTLNEVCNEFDFLCNCDIGQQDSFFGSGFVGNMLDLKLLSGGPSLDSEVVGHQSQEGSRNPKRCKCIKKTHRRPSA
jgi:hypothetical protein